MSTEKTCFVIAPIGEDGSETRERSNTVFEEVIKDVAQDYGYDCKRADHIDEPGIITNQVIGHIVESELVVADLTNKNPNVFYELAVRHAHEKPVIQILNKNQELPFDVATQRTIDIDLGNFSVTRRAKQQIGNQIEEIEANDFEIENPVSVAGYIRELRQSGEPEKQQLAEFTEILNELNAKIHSIEKDIQEIGSTRTGIDAEELQTMLLELGEIDNRLGNVYSDIGHDTFGEEEVKEEIESIGDEIHKLRRWIRSQKD